MKNVWIYHLIVDTPIWVFLIWYFEAGQPTITLIIFGIVYPFVFRPIMDYYRLLALGKIEKKDFRKMWRWGGLWVFKYYNSLMFENRKP